MGGGGERKKVEHQPWKKGSPSNSIRLAYSVYLTINSLTLLAGSAAPLTAIMEEKHTSFRFRGSTLGVSLMTLPAV